MLFNKQAENAAKYLKKGSLIYVEEKLSTRKYEDQKGEDRYITEIYATLVKYLANWKNEKTEPAEKADYGQYETSNGTDDCPF